MVDLWDTDKLAGNHCVFRYADLLTLVPRLRWPVRGHIRSPELPYLDSGIGWMVKSWEDLEPMT